MILTETHRHTEDNITEIILTMKINVDLPQTIKSNIRTITHVPGEKTEKDITNTRHPKYWQGMKVALN